MPERRVFLFGAGASKAEGGLLTSELLFESLSNNEVSDEFTQIVKSFLKDLFGIEDINRLNSQKEIPSFEELLTLTDLAILKQEEFSVSWDTCNLRQLREALIYCMARILRIKLSVRTGEEPNQKYHEQFINNILDEDNAVGNNCFLSLNYDILLDNPILNKYPRIDIDYGVSFRNMYEPRPGIGMKLLKLHGSLNWAFCPVCNSIKLYREGKISDRIIAERIPCEIEGAIQHPLLIPPTWLKVYDNAYLVKIWLESEHALREANSVFFIGYSLPESDFHIRYLLKKSLTRMNVSPRIVVITSPKNKIGSDLYLRYKRFFGKIEYHNIGFEKFSTTAKSYF
jgi:hypothetical protein